MQKQAQFIPVETTIKARFRDGDLIDYFPLSDHHVDATPSEIANELFSNMPAPFRALMWLRNVIVAPFGLKTEVSSDDPQSGIFPVEYESRQEIIFGTNDKHLDFRIFIVNTDQGAGFGTWVRRHNNFGRVYLALVMPFHGWICRYWQNAYKAEHDAQTTS